MYMYVCMCFLWGRGLASRGVEKVKRCLRNVAFSVMRRNRCACARCCNVFARNNKRVRAHTHAHWTHKPHTDHA